MDKGLLVSCAGFFFAIYDHYQNNKRGETINKKIDELLFEVERQGLFLEKISQNILIEKQGDDESLLVEVNQQKQIMLSSVRNTNELKKMILNNSLPCILDDKKDNIKVCTVSDTVINNTSEENVEFILYYSKRASSFSSQKCISINIPKDAEEYLQMNVINTEIDINKRLYFEIRDPLIKKSKFFHSCTLKERRYMKPVRIACWKNQEQIFLEVSMDGIIICKENWNVI